MSHNNLSTTQLRFAQHITVLSVSWLFYSLSSTLHTGQQLILFKGLSRVFFSFSLWAISRIASLPQASHFDRRGRTLCRLSYSKNTWAAGLYMQWVKLTAGSALKLPSEAARGREVIPLHAASRPREGPRPSRETKTDCGISQAWHARHGGQTADNPVGSSVWVSPLPG